MRSEREYSYYHVAIEFKISNTDKKYNEFSDLLNSPISEEWEINNNLEEIKQFIIYPYRNKKNFYFHGHNIDPVTIKELHIYETKFSMKGILFDLFIDFLNDAKKAELKTYLEHLENTLSSFNTYLNNYIQNDIIVYKRFYEYLKNLRFQVTIPDNEERKYGDLISQYERFIQQYELDIRSQDITRRFPEDPNPKSNNFMKFIKLFKDIDLRVKILEIIEQGDINELKKILNQNHILLTVDEIKEFIEIYKELFSQIKPANNHGEPIYDSKKIFIVHGHDEGSKYALAEIIKELELEPIILHARANAGKTIIEKFEDNISNIGYAIILLTPDDIGGINDGELKPRSRQNVILELGYFMGKLGRNRVCCIYKGDIETPSDIGGIAHLSYSNKVEECYRGLRRELRVLGYVR